MTFIALGLGSNRTFESKTPTQILVCAVNEISQFVSSLKVSSVYRTKAMYVEDQDDFYNMVVTGYYSGTATELLEQIHKVESQFGRDRSREYRNGPRPLDVDIELFGCQTLKTPDLVVPHERLFERAFVLVPLFEVLKLNADVLIENVFENVLTVQKLEDSLNLVKDQQIELFGTIQNNTFLEVGH